MHLFSPWADPHRFTVRDFRQVAFNHGLGAVERLPGPAEKYQVFRIENDQLLKLLGLEARPSFWRYSIEELRDKIPELLQRAERVRKLPVQERDLDFRSTLHGANDCIRLHGKNGVHLNLLRTDKTKGTGTREACLTMVHKLMESAAKSWRSLNGSHLLREVIQGT